MTGVFKVRGTLQKGGHIGRTVELPEEILNDLKRWWDNAEKGDTFEVTCELPD